MKLDMECKDQIYPESKDYHNYGQTKYSDSWINLKVLTMD